MKFKPVLSTGKQVALAAVILSAIGVVPLTMINWAPDSVSNAAILEPNALDIGYAQAMSKHHDEAIRLNRLMMNSQSDQLQAWVYSMSLAQSTERGLLTGWLTAWGKPAVPSGFSMEWVELDSKPLPGGKPLSVDDLNYINRCKSMGTDLMPGSPSVADFERLNRLQGAEKTRLYMELMSRHHEGAIEMSRFALRHAQSDLIRSFASQTIREQGKEMLWMTHWLVKPIQ